MVSAENVQEQEDSRAVLAGEGSGTTPESSERVLPARPLHANANSTSAIVPKPSLWQAPASSVNTPRWTSHLARRGTADLNGTRSAPRSRPARGSKEVGRIGKAGGGRRKPQGPVTSAEGFDRPWGFSERVLPPASQ